MPQTDTDHRYYMNKRCEVISPNSEIGKHIINAKVRISKQAREFFTEYAISPSTKQKIKKLKQNNFLTYQAP